GYDGGSIILAAIPQLHLGSVGAADDVKVSQDVALLVNDHPGADALLSFAARSEAALAEEVAKQSLVKILIFDDRLGRNVHDRRQRLFDCRNRRIAPDILLGGSGVTGARAGKYYCPYRCETQSARGQAQSKTWRWPGALAIFRQALNCACPLALW